MQPGGDREICHRSARLKRVNWQSVTPPYPATLNPEVLLAAYCQGAFPMTDHDGATRWYTADPRGVLPLDGFHCSRTLRQIVKQQRFQIRIDHDFEGTMRACMTKPRKESDTSWISEELVEAYAKLHDLGCAHSVEAYEKGVLVGGLYGVAIGAAFFGESMFQTVSNASKVCLVHLVQRLQSRGYELLDTQMVTAHMRQFGCVHIPLKEYMEKLNVALEKRCSFV
ncbi:MAG: leucyl/phenylalanyl-tRNA--protein transferase [Burkholderiales bacterium]|nr:leucyl/phenylalanyl-tRNA--protein transferase [Phycisphaerae bacterium]